MQRYPPSSNLRVREEDLGERYSLLPWRLLLNGQREGREEKSLERGREGRAFHMKREG